MSAYKDLTERCARVKTALARLDNLDWSLLRLKLADPVHGLGWDDGELSLAEIDYKQFLALTFAYPEEAFVPTPRADEFWHAHILDTRAYADDCEAAFGLFVHHFPYLGLRGPDDAALLVSVGRRTQELMDLHFGSGAALDLSALSSCGSCSGP